MWAYLNLTKPRISLLFAITGLTALIMEGSLRADPLRLWGIVLAIFLVSGSANAFNQYFERDIDREMTRTTKRRPLPLGLIQPRQALIFSIVIGIVSVMALHWWGGWLAAAFGAATIGFYSFYYTLWLKPRTPYNIVIGGAAGAMAPLIGWAAASGTVAWAPVLLFLLIFCWTPPHFWALALCCKADYARVGLPMLPNVRGDAVTRRQILWYSLSLLPLSLSLYFLDLAGSLYFWSALILSAIFIVGAVRIYRQHTEQVCRQLFGYSILYVLLLFVVLIVDAL